MNTHSGISELTYSSHENSDCQCVVVAVIYDTPVEYGCFSLYRLTADYAPQLLPTHQSLDVTHIVMETGSHVDCFLLLLGSYYCSVPVTARLLLLLGYSSPAGDSSR